ncbi:MAG: GNAT family N-acetyltransferase [Caldilineales bacterium]|nr:GNAT family N-acetyltransferase [Caldilineales bacterium]
MIALHISFRLMSIQDYDTILSLWQAAEGVGLSAADERTAIARYLERNPGLSFTAWEGELLVGAVLCGHDGRRGFIHHLAVAESHRRQGVGGMLVEQCLAGLRQEGIDKCHLFVYRRNTSAQAFWEEIGWTRRDDLHIMSRTLTLP